MAKTQKIGKTVKIDNDDCRIIEADDIQSDKKVKNPFSEKNIILLIFLLIISIVLVVLTIKFVMDIDFKKLFEAMGNGFHQELGWLWFSLLLCSSVYMIFMHYATLWVRIRKWGFKIPQREYWLFAGCVAFLKAVTPVLVSDPYTIFWMKTKGIPTSKCTSLMFSNTLSWQICQLLMSLPSFIMILVCRDKILLDPQGISAFSFMCAGIIVDLFSLAFMVLMCFSKRTHYVLSLVFNWFKKKFHMKYHTKAQIADKYKEKATIKRDIIEFIKDWKTTLLVFAIFVVNELVGYLNIIVSLKFIQNVTSSIDGKIYNVGFSIGWAFNCAVAAGKANRLNFIAPGGEGTIEFFFYQFLYRFGNWKITPTPQEEPEIFEKNVCWNSILIWRSFGSFLPAILGMGCMIGLTSKQIVSYKKDKKLIK